MVIFFYHNIISIMCCMRLLALLKAHFFQLEKMFGSENDVSVYIKY